MTTVGGIISPTKWGKQLSSTTVSEDIAVAPLSLRKTREEPAAQIVDRVQRQLDLMFLKNWTNYKLSGGESRLVSLATMLLMKPDVLPPDGPNNAHYGRNEARLIIS